MWSRPFFLAHASASHCWGGRGSPPILFCMQDCAAGRALPWRWARGCSARPPYPSWCNYSPEGIAFPNSNNRQVCSQQAYLLVLPPQPQLHPYSAPGHVRGSPPQVEQPHISPKRPLCGCSSGRISAKQHQQRCSIPGCAAPHVAAEVGEEPPCGGCDSTLCFSSKLIRLFSGFCSSRLPCGSPVWV